MRLYYLYIFLVIISCSSPKPQRPIQHHKMQMEESLVKKDFELDKEIIEEYIKQNDTLEFKNNAKTF